MKLEDPLYIIAAEALFLREVDARKVHTLLIVKPPDCTLVTY